MTILSSLYKSMSGLLGFSAGLNSLSNNVANLNTPGFKGRDVFYRELGSSNPEFSAGDNAGFGQGVRVAGSSLRLAQGDITETGNQGDIAIDGNGFFILRGEKENFYSRSGQFRIDEDGFLVDPGTGLRVGGLDNSGKLVDIVLRRGATSDAIPTTSIVIGGQLPAAAGSGSRFPPEGGERVSVSTFAANGATEEIFVSFLKASGSVWQVQFEDVNGSVIAPTHSIEFNGLGVPLIDSQEFELDFELFDYVNEDLINDRLALAAAVAIDSADLSSSSLFELSISEGNLLTRNSGAISFVDGGSFAITADGFVESSDGARLASRTQDGVLQDLSISELLATQPISTSSVTLGGVLDSDSAVGGFFPAIIDPPIEFEVVTATGTTEVVQLRLEKVGGREWRIVLEDSIGNISRPVETLNFLELAGGGDAVLRADNQLVDVNLNFSSGETARFNLGFGGNETVEQLVLRMGAEAQLDLLEVDGSVESNLVSIALADSGVLELTYEDGQQALGPQLAVVQRSGIERSAINVDLSGITNSSAVTEGDIEILSTDGRSIGQLVNFDFQEDGNVNLQFSNGEVESAGKVALALISNANELESLDDTLFRFVGDDVVVGEAGQGAFGSLNANAIELSNVDLSREFAEIIIVQRGYQASSQILNATNEMIEELYNSVRS